MKKYTQKKNTVNGILWESIFYWVGSAVVVVPKCPVPTQLQDQLHSGEPVTDHAHVPHSWVHTCASVEDAGGVPQSSVYFTYRYIPPHMTMTPMTTNPFNIT